MAAARKSFLYFDRISPMMTNDSQFEFDEAEVWNSSELAPPPDHHQGSNKKLIMQNPRAVLKKPLMIKKSSSKSKIVNAATSLPVNIPDWSRILGDEYKEVRIKRSDHRSEDEDDDENGRLPPHEYLARTRGSSFSVHEGIGRTLKGRDLSRVRNAVWKQIGFED